MIARLEDLVQSANPTSCPILNQIRPGTRRGQRRSRPSQDLSQWNGEEAW